MRLTVYTSNQPRHAACLEALAAAHTVTAVVEPKSRPAWETLTPYWQRVRDAEAVVFGPPRPIRCPVYVLPMGDASVAKLVPSADRYVVFGSSYLRGWLAQQLIALGAVNLHVGIAPEYRGSACNAWATYDGNHHLVGAQVQRLSRGVDAGAILAEARVPEDADPDPFARSMLAVQGGIRMLVLLLERPEPWHPIRGNDVAQTIRYTRGADWTVGEEAVLVDRYSG